MVTQVELIGEIDDAEKAGIPERRQALLLPIDWPEPFGLVMIEAMACGTPVIAFNRGSVPEIVDHGVTGFIVADEAECVAAPAGAAAVAQRRSAHRFEQRFTARSDGGRLSGALSPPGCPRASGAAYRAVGLEAMMPVGTGWGEP